MSNKRYKRSEQSLQKALSVIPLGSQTFSKSMTQFPYGVSPYFMDRAEGAHCWDVDDNQYIDLNNALASVVLGHCDPEVTAAVEKQLHKGTIFSTASLLETEVAERLVTMIPCAEMVRFGKNGSDATSAAIRLARAVTNRDRVVVCGYHGWHDWYIGSTSQDRGVPQAVKNLTDVFQYNDIGSLENLFHKHHDTIAAVIMEPMNLHYPDEGFLDKVKQLTHKNGALLVFDETVTGFRLSKGGAQELFGVNPDLATFGKGLANGYPLSAVVGRKELMNEMTSIFFSSTFGGETLSLAAAKVTLDRFENENVVGHLAKVGGLLKKGLKDLIYSKGLQDYFTTCGHDSWNFLIPNCDSEEDLWNVKTFLMQELLADGILSLGSNNISYKTSVSHVEYVLKSYDRIFGQLVTAIENKEISALLHCQPLRPLFRVR